MFNNCNFHKFFSFKVHDRPSYESPYMLMLSLRVRRTASLHCIDQTLSTSVTVSMCYVCLQYHMLQLSLSSFDLLFGLI